MVRVKIFIKLIEINLKDSSLDRIIFVGNLCFVHQPDIPTNLTELLIERVKVSFNFLFSLLDIKNFKRQFAMFNKAKILCLVLKIFSLIYAFISFLNDG